MKEKMVWIEKPDKGENCLYWKPYQETYGRCTLPANRDESEMPVAGVGL